MEYLKYLTLTVLFLLKEWTKGASGQFFPASVFPSNGNPLSSVPSLFPVLGGNNNNDISGGARPAPNSEDRGWPYYGGNGDNRPQQLQQQIQQQPLQNWQQLPNTPQRYQNWQSQLQPNQQQQLSPFYNQYPRQDQLQPPQQQQQQFYPSWQQQSGPQTRPIYNQDYKGDQAPAYNINNPLNGFQNFFNSPNPNWYNNLQQQLQPPQQVAAPETEPSSPNQQFQSPASQIQSPSLLELGDNSQFPSTLSKPSIQLPTSPQTPQTLLTPGSTNDVPPPNSLSQPQQTSNSQPSKPLQQNQWAPSIGSIGGQNNNNGLSIQSPASPQAPSTPVFDDGMYKPQLHGDGGNGYHLLDNSGSNQMAHQQEQIHNILQSSNLNGSGDRQAENFDMRLNSPDGNKNGQGQGFATPNSQDQFPERSSTLDSPTSYDAPNSWVYPDDLK